MLMRKKWPPIWALSRWAKTRHCRRGAGCPYFEDCTHIHPLGWGAHQG